MPFQFNGLLYMFGGNYRCGGVCVKKRQFSLVVCAGGFVDSWGWMNIG